MGKRLHERSSTKKRKGRHPDQREERQTKMDREGGSSGHNRLVKRRKKQRKSGIRTENRWASRKASHAQTIVIVKEGGYLRRGSQEAGSQVHDTVATDWNRPERKKNPIAPRGKTVGAVLSFGWQACRFKVQNNTTMIKQKKAEKKKGKVAFLAIRKSNQIKSCEADNC